MRYFLLAALALMFLSSQGRAQYIGGFQTQVTPMPYYYGPPVHGQAAFASPYGYQSFSNYGVQYGYYGPATYSTTGTFVRPQVSGPLHSVYWDPFANTYRYTTGTLNTPTYFYGVSRYPY